MSYLSAGETIVWRAPWRSPSSPSRGFADDATPWMMAHRWPGNVRGLENIVERAAVLANGPVITRDDLATEFAMTEGLPSLRPTLESPERQYVQRILLETGGDKQAAARILGVSSRTLQRRVTAR